MKRVLFVVTFGLLAQGCAGVRAQAPAAAAAPKAILIIGDGMDDQQITIARNYLVGSGGRLILDSMPYRGAVQILTVDEDDPQRPLYVADSANTATSMATGGITSPGRISTTAGGDADLVTIMELAQARGLGTGIVTTASVTDATPAAFVAHVNERFCQGPRDMVSTFGELSTPIDCSVDYKANGGRGSIAEQIADSRMDIVLGGGTFYFDQPAEGTSGSVAELAATNGFKVIRSRAELASLDATARVLGLFARNTLPVELRGVGDARATRVTKVDGHVELPKPFGCEPNPGFAGMPTLAEMTRAALGRLDGDRGFMLMVESASIDKQSHLRRPCGHIGELGQLDAALEVALDYGARHPETLILVTADHSHAAQIVSETGEFLALGVASPGHLALVATPEGGIMGVNYATNDSDIQEYHTGAEVPLLASGAGADALPAFVQQPDIFRILRAHLRLAAAHPADAGRAE